jgi:hypothetical protein
MRCGGIIVNDWKKFGRKQLWPTLRYYPRICLEGLRETAISHDMAGFKLGTSQV